MKETELWSLLRQKIPGHLVRIENLVTKGVPDVHCCYQGKHTWLELKIASGNYVYFQSSQIAFMADVIKHKENMKVLMRKKELIYVINPNVIINSCKTEQKNDKVQIEIKNLSSASIWGQPWRWDEIVKEIYDL